MSRTKAVPNVHNKTEYSGVFTDFCYCCTGVGKHNSIWSRAKQKLFAEFRPQLGTREMWPQTACQQPVREGQASGHAGK